MNTQSALQNNRVPPQKITSKEELQSVVKNCKSQGLKIGYVPTMGALHDGHLSLVKLAKEKANKVIVSIFVNPTQFAPNEDFDTYPRDEDGDFEKLKAAGADCVYLPSIEEMYPDGMEGKVKAGKASNGLETDFRPTFFDGVANVVSRLFDHVKPDVAIFGQKDYQQLCVIREMVDTLDLPITIVGAPIVRDTDGLALSSRNAYLSKKERQISLTLNKTLFSIADKIKDDPHNTDQYINEGTQALINAGFDTVDYIAVRIADTLAPYTPQQDQSHLKTPKRILAAAWLGKTRLIDNVSA